MAVTISFTVPDAVVPRIQAAFGTTDPTTGTRIPATVADFKAALKNGVKATVTAYEAGIANQATYDSVNAEAW